MNSLGALLRFFIGSVRANVQVALEYRTSLISQALGMYLSNGMWLVFFAAYFDRFSLPGWSRNDVITLWAMAAGAFGFAGMFFGNAARLSGFIVRGELDFYLALPKPPLLHVLISRMSLVSLGDLAFALVAFELTHPTLVQRGLFVVCVITAAAITVAFAVIAGSLAFWLGNSETAAGQLYNALINFSTYPSQLFKGAALVITRLIIPAAFVTGVPVELLRTPRWTLVLEELGAAAVFITLAVTAFHFGLRRYTSGNVLALRD